MCGLFIFASDASTDRRRLPARSIFGRETHADRREARLLAQPSTLRKVLLESRVQPHSQAHGRDKEDVATAQILRPYLFLCALVLAGILPFASRAVYMDEPQYLHVAHSAV